MTDPLISVIVPVYNAEPFLDRCVRSILDQDEPRFELLLVDDGSTDRSGKLCDGWAEKDGRVRVFHRENGGQSAARNLGLDHAKGAYLSFVDSDDYVSPDYLSYLLSLFTPACRWAECNHYVVRGEGRKPDSAAEDRILSRKEAFEEVLFHGCVDVAPWGKLYRSDVFDGLRFPEGRIFEDTWLFGDLLNRTEKAAFGKRCCYYYVIHDQSTVRKEFSPRNLQYIEAAEKLAADARKCSPDLETGCVRRINHARLSVLRYMEHSGEKELRDRLRRQVLAESPLYLGDPRTPQRDRTAVALLRRGYFAFYTGWKAYERFRQKG